MSKPSAKISNNVLLTTQIADKVGIAKNNWTYPDSFSKNHINTNEFVFLP